MQNSGMVNVVKPMSDIEAYVLTEIAPQISLGATWGFLHKYEEKYAEKWAQLTRLDKAYVMRKQVSNGCVFVAAPSYLEQLGNKVMPGIIDKTFTDRKKERVANESARFRKYMLRLLKGDDTVKSVSMPLAGGHRCITVALFNVNKSDKIFVNTQEYPAFRLDIIEAVCALQTNSASASKDVNLLREAELLQRLYVMSSGVGVKSAVPLLAAMQRSEGREQIFNAMSLAETKAGVFVQFII